MSSVPDSSSQLNVLLVDDSPFQLLLVRRKLEEAGFKVSTAQNGAEALAMMVDPLPAVVVSDCQMPILDGYQLCRLLKDDLATRHVPVVLLTAQGGGLSRFWAQTCEADCFLTKSGDFQRLIATVQDLAQRARPSLVQAGATLAPPREGQDVQARLAQVLERRLIETTLHAAIARLYRPEAETETMLAGVLDLLEGLVGDGALLVGFAGTRGHRILGTRGAHVPQALTERLAESVVALLGPAVPHDVTWRVPGSPEASSSKVAWETRILPAALPGESPVGALAIAADPGTLAVHAHYLDLAANEMARLLSLEQKRVELLRLATEDALTGLHNRRHILSLLASDGRQSKRYDQPLTVGILDIDHFKLFNDRFGHQTGDAVLQLVAKTLRTSVRDVDHVGRIGGEEFLVVFPGTPLQGAMVIAERLRLATEMASAPELPAGERVTISLGLAQWQDGGGSMDALVAQADAALYRAKASGRNRVVAAEWCAEPPKIAATGV